MRKVITLLIVVSLLLGVEWVARRMDNLVPAVLTWDTQFSQDKWEQIQGLDDPIEVVFAGSSVAQADLDPVFFAEASQQFATGYNAAIPSVGPRVWREFMLDTIYRELCPALVVIGVDVRQFSDNQPDGDNSVARYLNARGRLEAIDAAGVWDKAEEWLESKSALFRVRPRLREPDKMVAWIWDIGDKGYWRYTNLTPLGRYGSNDARTYEATQEGIDRLANTAFLDFSIGGVETNAIRQMIADARQHGAVPVLVEMPVMNDALSAALPNGVADLEWFTTVLGDLAEETQVPFIRIPALDDDPKFYSDFYHMNLTGVEAVSRLLAERIDELQLDVGSGSCPDS